MADGDAPIPASGMPPGTTGPLSEQQIQDTVDDMLDGQDLSPAEAQQLSEQLKNQLRQASGDGLPFDQAYAKAEDFAWMYMANLHRSYVRKATRLGTFADTPRTSSGDLITPQRGVIPAARDASGDLIWVDKNTGARVPAGTPDAMTVPERGSYHLGHKYGYENWRVLRQAAEEGWTQQELNDFMNRHGLYDVETPANNLSHRYEDNTPYAPNPEWTPERLQASPAAAPVPAGGAPAAAPGSPVAVPGSAPAQAPMISPPPDLTLPPHPTTIPPWLQQPVPPGYQVTPPSVMATNPLDPTGWLPMDMPDPPPAPVPSTPSSDGVIDLGFSPSDVAGDVGKGIVGAFIVLGAFLGAVATAGHPTAGAG